MTPTVAIGKYWPVAELYALLLTAEGVADVVVDADKARNHSLADAVHIIESVDSISTNERDAPLTQLIHYKRWNNSCWVHYYGF